MTPLGATLSYWGQVQADKFMFQAFLQKDCSGTWSLCFSEVPAGLSFHRSPNNTHSNSLFLLPSHASDLLPIFLFSSSASREPRRRQSLTTKTVPSHLKCDATWRHPSLSPALGCKLLEAPQYSAQCSQVEDQTPLCGLPGPQDWAPPISLTSLRPSSFSFPCIPATLASLSFLDSIAISPATGPLHVPLPCLELTLHSLVNSHSFSHFLRKAFLTPPDYCGS